MRVVIRGRSGKESPAEAGACEPDGASDPGLIVPSVIMVILLISGFVFPPLLLLNIPILLLRAAWSYSVRAGYDRLRIGVFDCPDCGASNPPTELAGALPLDAKCVGCGCALEVRQAPRRNLVDEPPGAPT